MPTILLALGIVVIAAGAAMLAFGIANNGFDVGNALIIAGTVAVVGGVIAVGLSAAVRELARMRRLLDPRTAARPAAQLEERAQSKLEPAAATKAAEAKTPAPGDLSQVLAEPTAAAAAAELARPAPDTFVPPRGDAPRRERGRERIFDTVWAPPSAPKPDAAKPEAGEKVPAAEEPARPATEPLAIRPSREPQAVTILKSGVIDGMAYTLYSDGSIEADLPQGMARFNSIDALRRHLGEQKS
jgi:hypothetical protein